MNNLSLKIFGTDVVRDCPKLFRIQGRVDRIRGYNFFGVVHDGVLSFFGQICDGVITFSVKFLINSPDPASW